MPRFDSIPVRSHSTRLIATKGLPFKPNARDDLDEVWEYTVAQLEGINLASPVDRDMVAAYCEAVVLHRRATLTLRQTGLIFKNRFGEAIPNPAMRIQLEAARVMMSYAKQFGFTPLARTEIRRGIAQELPESAEPLAMAVNG